MTSVGFNFDIESVVGVGASNTSGGGSSNIIGGVNVAYPPGPTTTGQSIVYNAVSNQWTFRLSDANMIHSIPVKDTPAPTDTQSMVYDSTNSEWTYNLANANKINSIPVKDTPAPADTQSMVYDSTNSEWTYNLANANKINSIPVKDTPAPTHGQVLTYDSILGSWIYSLSAGIVPPGTMLPFAGATVPAGYLWCDGTSVSRTTYANLFSAIGIAWGEGEDSSVFNLPDMRGMFARGVDMGAGRDPDAASRLALNIGGNTGDKVGSYQFSTYENHNHFLQNASGHLSHVYDPIGGTIAINTGSTAPTTLFEELPFAAETTFEGGNETRPINVNVNWIIKY
jgi:microcystin-dependent protein